MGLGAAQTSRSHEGIMGAFPDDIFTEPSDVDPDTLANLRPLRAMAGIWEG